MLYTGERFIPTDEPRLRQSACEHLHRYYMAAPYVKGKVVLDAACGSGYGSKIMSTHALKVSGVDIARESVEYAAANFAAPNIEFITASIERLPFADNVFDVVVSFETIEHVGLKTQIMFLREVKRVLKPRGIFLISSPDKDAAFSRTDGENIFHVREFTAHELIEFLSAFFNNVSLYSQTWAVASFITGGSDSLEIFDPVKSLGKNPLYNIAVCGDHDISPPPQSLLWHDTADAARNKFYFDACGSETLLRNVVKAANIGLAYFSDGGDFSENNKVSFNMCYSPETGAFSAEFPVLPDTRKIQFNPCDAFLCMCKIESINGGLSIIPANMDSRGGYDVAFEPCPHYIITGDFCEISTVRITGSLKILTNYGFLTVVHDFVAELKNEIRTGEKALYENELYGGLCGELHGQWESTLALLKSKETQLAVSDTELKLQQQRANDFEKLLDMAEIEINQLKKRLNSNRRLVASMKSKTSALNAVRDALTYELAYTREKLGGARINEAAARESLSVLDKRYKELRTRLAETAERSALREVSLLDELSSLRRENSKLREEYLNSRQECSNLKDSLGMCKDSLTYYDERVIPELCVYIQGLENKIAKQRKDMTEKEHILSEIWNSNAWALVKRYYRLKDVFKALLKKIKRESRISVVIPTKNAGGNFCFLLSCLNNQVGIEPPEIIVVDSGSDDDTRSVAKEYGAVIIDIKNFTHSNARNLGVSKASGEYTLLLTQDALPCSEYFIRDVLRFMKKERLAAVTCLEFPRSGSDMTHSFSRWNHIRTFGYKNDDYVSSLNLSGAIDFHREDVNIIRKNVNLSNVCCLIETKTAKKYKYRGTFAEDLDIGLRLYKDGHRLGFMQSCKILHSHCRPPSYYLKRSFADITALNELLPVPRGCIFNLNYIAGNTVKCLIALSYIIRCILIKADEMFTVYDYCELTYSAFEQARSVKDICCGFEFPDEDLTEIINRIRVYDTGERPEDMFMSMYGSVKLACEYLSECHNFVNSEISAQFTELVISFFASRVGEFCAYYSIDCPEDYAETLKETISAAGI